LSTRRQARIAARTALGRRLLALVPRDRTWWAPDHFHLEAAGALRRMKLRGLITEMRARGALDHLLSMPITEARSRPLIPEAWTRRHNLIVQDAVYVVLARHLDAPLLIGDRRPANAPDLPVQVLHT
jgi:predicted nucleic acid-binding protein